jgi:hypothetical protein
MAIPRKEFVLKKMAAEQPARQVTLCQLQSSNK